jgi:hypothetical protein
VKRLLGNAAFSILAFPKAGKTRSVLLFSILVVLMDHHEPYFPHHFLQQLKQGQIMVTGEAKVAEHNQVNPPTASTI